MFNSEFKSSLVGFACTVWLRLHFRPSSSALYYRALFLTLFLFAICRRSTVADRRLRSSSSSLCWWHSDLRVVLANAVLVHGTTERYIYKCIDVASSSMLSHRLQLNTAKTPIIWLTTGRRLHLLPQQPLRVGSGLITPVLVVRDVGIHIDAYAFPLDIHLWSATRHHLTVS